MTNVILSNFCLAFWKKKKTCHEIYYSYKKLYTQYVSQMLTSMKWEINNNTIIVGDFKPPLTPMDRSTKHKINKERQASNDTIDQLDLTDIYRTLHPKTMNFTFFSSKRGTVSRTDHILGHKSSFGKFRKTEIIPSTFSDHNAVRLDVNYRRKTI